MGRTVTKTLAWQSAANKVAARAEKTLFRRGQKPAPPVRIVGLPVIGQNDQPSIQGNVALFPDPNVNGMFAGAHTHTVAHMQQTVDAMDAANPANVPTPAAFLPRAQQPPARGPSHLPFAAEPQPHNRPRRSGAAASEAIALKRNTDGEAKRKADNRKDAETKRQAAREQAKKAAQKRNERLGKNKRHRETTEGPFGGHGLGERPRKYARVARTPANRKRRRGPPGQEGPFGGHGLGERPRKIRRVVRPPPNLAQRLQTFQDLRGAPMAAPAA